MCYQSSKTEMLTGKNDIIGTSEITYIGIKPSLPYFLVKMRWFSDKIRDSLNKILMDLYHDVT